MPGFVFLERASVAHGLDETHHLAREPVIVWHGPSDSPRALWLGEARGATLCEATSPSKPRNRT